MLTAKIYSSIVEDCASAYYAFDGKSIEEIMSDIEQYSGYSFEYFVRHDLSVSIVHDLLLMFFDSFTRDEADRLPMRPIVAP